MNLVDWSSDQAVAEQCNICDCFPGKGQTSAFYLYKVIKKHIQPDRDQLAMIIEYTIHMDGYPPPFSNIHVVILKLDRVALLVTVPLGKFAIHPFTYLYLQSQ